MTMPDSIKQWRKERRTELLARRMAVAPERRREWNDAITAALLDGFPQLQEAVIGFYWPFKGEFDPRFAIHGFRKYGAKAALPVVLEKAGPLQFREWWPGVGTTKGVFDLPVPEGTDALTPQALLIPPIGFDSAGYRLGYGGGYFDRTLAALMPHPLKIGVAFELSRMPSIQPQPHDIPMDFVITENGIHVGGRAGLELITNRTRVGALAGAIAARRNLRLGSAPGQTPRQAASDVRFAGQSSFSRCYARAVEAAGWRRLSSRQSSSKAGAAVSQMCP